MKLVNFRYYPLRLAYDYHEQPMNDKYTNAGYVASEEHHIIFADGTCAVIRPKTTQHAVDDSDVVDCT